MMRALWELRGEGSWGGCPVGPTTVELKDNTQGVCKHPRLSYIHHSLCLTLAFCCVGISVVGAMH